MKVFGVVNQKGGVAKTTSCVTLAHGLAMCGVRTLLVDLDAQGNVSDALGLEKRGGVQELLFGDLGQAVTESRRPNLDVVLSDHSTAQARERLTGVSFREQVLAARLGELVARARYEVVLLDTAPGVDLLQISALVAVTEFVIPVELSHLAVVGASDLLGSVASLRKLGGFQGRFLGILPTMWDQRSREGASQLAALRRQFGDLVWPAVPVDAKAREASRAGQSLWEYAPRCRALRGSEVRQNDEEDTVRLEGGYGRVLRRLIGELGIVLEGRRDG